MSGFTDITLTCRDCGEGFVFTAGQQEFFAEKGFENQPSRCKDCNQARKAGKGGGGSYGGGSYGGSSFGGGSYGGGGGSWRRGLVDAPLGLPSPHLDERVCDEGYRRRNDVGSIQGSVAC
eukprot:CAMPEP_0174340412 /NCGR_PEP_ID=MMETSP0810-20121108/24652_1 /TAXON_ID=73025 ORGANISM="Eutreptiella gymnastica-like, Strain CCMP1594" /NCGR_SAMPLE_ID=MMETSP0810 /ASSEMBLY_ACC=CAM_ASM_000659 /LENGTH=119 /DNA_ID=CAMNT_0015461555 /DNA_START=42 /DNA_END=401 /DNA_ORIENTATION=-